jgi:hypothetical protein
MLTRRWITFLVAAVLILGGLYGYYKFSSTGYLVGVAKRGRVIDGKTHQPIAGAWIIAQWVASGCNIVRCGGPGLVSAALTRTDRDGVYAVPARWRELTEPLNKMPWNTGKYTFRLAVFVPRMQLDCSEASNCNTYINLPLSSLSNLRPTGYTWRDGGVEEHLPDIAMVVATSPLQVRAEVYVRWGSDAFPYSDDRAAPLWEGGPTSTEIKLQQTSELMELACAETGTLSDSVVHDIELSLPWSGRQTFAEVAKGGYVCDDVPERCRPIEAKKICAGMRAALDAAKGVKGATP